MVVEIQINNSVNARARYLTWAPSACRIRVTDPTGVPAPIDMSVLGLSSILPVPYSPWWEVVLFALMTANLATVWWRGRTSGRMAGFRLVAAEPWRSSR